MTATTHDSYEPRTLSSGRNRILDVLVSTVLLVSTFPLFIFAGLVASLDGHVVNDQSYWDKIRRVTQALASIFPIWFAIIVGLTIRRFAAWRLEQGIKLRSLDQLMGSLSVGGTVVTTWSLRSLNLYALLLFLVWGVSPLGGQSSLQMIVVRGDQVTSPVELLYLQTLGVPRDRHNPGGVQLSGANAWVSMETALNALYNACLLTPPVLRKGNLDMWGNVKIPDIRTLRAAGAQADKDGWFSTADAPQLEYSSLLGMPVSGLQADGNTIFNMESTYLALSCHDTGVKSFQDHITCTPFGVDANRRVTYINDTFNGNITASEKGEWTLCMDGFYDTPTYGTYGSVASFPNDTTFPYAARSLLFQSASRTNAENSFFGARCFVTTEYVESSIACHGKNCSATALRPSTPPSPTRRPT